MGTISRNDEEAAGGRRTERDEPSFINLDRLLNPGFDETLSWKRTYMYVTTRRFRVHALT